MSTDSFFRPILAVILIGRLSRSDVGGLPLSQQPGR